MVGDYDRALNDVAHGLSLNSNHAFSYSTKAEIFGMQGDRGGFYSNIKRAFTLGCPVWDLIEDEAYERYREEKRFHAVLQGRHTTTLTFHGCYAKRVRFEHGEHFSRVGSKAWEIE